MGQNARKEPPPSKKELKEALPGKTTLGSVQEDEGSTTVVLNLHWPTPKRGSDGQIKSDEKPLKIVSYYFWREKRDRKKEDEEKVNDDADDDLESKLDQERNEEAQDGEEDDGFGSDKDGRTSILRKRCRNLRN